ncbi:MAG: hypothetical protein V3T30_03525 [Thermodesulfobacteriota bacterium]
MDRVFQNRSFHLIAVAVVLLSVLIVYSNTFHASFHFDDFLQVVENPAAKEPARALETLAKRTRPLTVISFALNHAIGGAGVEGYHAVNITIHMLNSILVYFILFLTFTGLKFEASWSKRISVFSALLFAVHPVQIQSVTYIIQRMESQSALFYLSAILCFILAISRESRLWRLLFYALVPISYILALYSKEVAITLPAVIILYDIYFTRAPRFKAVLSRWPLYGVLLLVMLYFTVTTVLPLAGFDDIKNKLISPISSAELSESDFPERPGFSLVSTAHAATAPAVKNDAPVYVTSGLGILGLGPKEYILTELNVLTYYLLLLAVPMNQNLDYDFPVSRRLLQTPERKHGAKLTVPIPPPVVSLLILLAIIGAAIYLVIRRRGKGVVGSARSPVISYFIFWFFIILSPTSSFIPIIDVISEQRLYLASLGFFVVLVLFVDFVVERLSRVTSRVGGGGGEKGEQSL